MKKSYFSKAEFKNTFKVVFHTLQWNIFLYIFHMYEGGNEKVKKNYL